MRGGIKSGRMSQISELPVARSLAWPVALSTLAGGVERDLVSAWFCGGYAHPHTKSTEWGGHRHNSEDASRTQDPWQPGTEAADQKVLGKRRDNVKFTTG